MAAMSRPADPRHAELARRLLAYEAGSGQGADACATGAGRIYDKIPAGLVPLLGAAGVRALLERSVKLSRGELGWLDVSVVESATKLRDSLRAQEPSVAPASVAVLFGTFFELLTTFIGARLTAEILRSAWPTIDEAVFKESDQ
jgi:hypothetical protein